MVNRINQVLFAILGISIFYFLPQYTPPRIGNIQGPELSQNLFDTIDFSQCLARWNDPEVQKRIEEGIENNRKGNASLMIQDEYGRPVSNVPIRIQQISHDFLFGSNFLYKDVYEIDFLNNRYEALYSDMFNLATIPIHWYQVEPQKDVFNYDSVRQKIHYGLSIDDMVAFCQKHGLIMRGHPIIWERSQPRWTPDDPFQLAKLYQKRFNELSNQYRQTIKYWDVVNDPLNNSTNPLLPHDYTSYWMNMANKYFVSNNQLGINATTRNCWLDFYASESPLYSLIKDMQTQDVRIDYIGMQFHLWYGRDFINSIYNGTKMTPKQLFTVLDQYGELGLPIHITEITLPVVLYQEVAEAWQAILGANYFRLFFSHPNIESLTWSNFTDELARDGKHYKGALTGDDLRLKPIYHAIRKLIKEDWQTRFKSSTDQSGQITFRGFYGRYKIQFERKGQLVEKEIHLQKAGENIFQISLE